MKTLLILSICCLGLGVSASAKKSSSTPSGMRGPKLTTDARFDGSTVAGKVQAPMEALTVVENEKNVDDLIGVRKNFNDRSEKSKGLR